MPELNIKTKWTLDLSTFEMRLILKALGGRLKEEDLKEATELGEKLSALRATMTRTALIENDKLLSNLGIDS